MEGRSSPSKRLAEVPGWNQFCPRHFRLIALQLTNSQWKSTMDVEASEEVSRRLGVLRSESTTNFFLSFRLKPNAAIPAKIGRGPGTCSL